jgi:hypothetical protein
MILKTIVLALSLVLGGAQTSKVYAQTQVPLHVADVDPTGSQGHYPRTPMLTPSASLDGHTFYINGGHADFVVQLLDEDNNVVYQTVMPSDVSSIVLPSTLSGTYQIQLLWGDWMFYGWIDL